MRWRSGRFASWAWRFAVVLVTARAGMAADAPAPDPAEARVRALLDAKLVFDRYVFQGQVFPECRFDRPEAVKDAIGEFTIRPLFFGPQFKLVDRAEVPGPYGAMVEVVPKSGRSLQRFVTLYRAAGPWAADSRVRADDPKALSDREGFDAGVVARESALIAATLKDRPFEEWSRDPAAARLLAGLAETWRGQGSLRKFEDAFAADRQWWVALKRDGGLGVNYYAPIVCPRPIEGPPARVLRDGSVSEAGMKPETAEAIDAVCHAWGADTDQAFAVCVARHGVIVLHRAYGTRDGKPMTVETRSWMASITKLMSATLMMMLVDQGIVKLDDQVGKFFPVLRDIEVETPLTIRHLYTHTNGLAKWPGWSDEMPDLEYRIADYYPLLKVGKEWAYTGTGNMLGGKIIEAVSGEAVPVFFWNHLLGPLGCVNTDVSGTHGDARSVPLDMARFAQMLLNRGAYGPFRFFREETFEQMLPRKLTAVLGPDATKTFGIGMDGSPARFGHGAASSATFHVDVANDLIVIVCRDKAGKNDERYNGKFWDAIKRGMIDPAPDTP